MRVITISKSLQKYDEDVEERDKEIHSIADTYHIRGYEIMPYDKEQVSAFRVQLNEIMATMVGEFEKLQVSHHKLVRFSCVYIK